MNYEPNVRYSRGVDPQVRQMSVICDVCDKPRNKGRHDKCSKTRQAAGFKFLADKPAGAPTTCAGCKRVFRFDAMVGNTCRGCHALTLRMVMGGGEA
ncbi:hypothetical protein [Pseudomonas sp. DG56-2]|uniref:hypothetical protein n=1 Tax=Pseudomonas sp. DG56-2 TaxID=2320270 RepID=UPI0010A60FF6|nr:hypothetical protein [Pseudomonas sp. DG56-2]